jgi:outer membrane protein OmpA-like peptidoglycan-associated protein
MEMESRVPEQPETKVVQPEKETPQKEEVEQKTDTITKEVQVPQEDTRRLSMQIDTMNKALNEKLMQLEEQQRESQTKADQKTIDYMESLRRIQEVDTMRSNQPEMDSLMKEEFRKLSLQIQEYENERMIRAIPEVADTVIDTENINLKDSIRRLQSELQEIKDQPAEVITRIIEKPVESIKVVKTIDIESIPVVDVFFELGSAVVSASEEAKIRNTAQLLTDYPESKVILTGMADATGNSDRNLELSLKRAEYVRGLLVQKYAVDTARIKVNSIGSSLSERKNVFDRKVSMKMVLSF